MNSLFRSLLLCTCLACQCFGASYSDVQSRVTHDVTNQRPIVIHVIVALCDNHHQGIVPVSAKLGNGQDARNNLYWGAMYGVRSHLLRTAGWRLLTENIHDNDSILSSLAAIKRMPRGEDSVTVCLMAEAWDGRYIRGATMRFLDMAGGAIRDTTRLNLDGDTLLVPSGGNAHIVCYVGHNGLMDFTPTRTPIMDSAAPVRSAVALACASKHYFLSILQDVGAHPLLLTTGLMAPEAYTLATVIRSFVSGDSDEHVVVAAADAYAKYQKCSSNSARRLFYSAP